MQTFSVLCCVLFFCLILGGGASSPLPPFHSSSPPEKEQRRGPFYDDLPPRPPARSGAPEKFGQSQILLENIAYYDHSPVNFARSPFFIKKKNKFRKFTNAVLVPDQQTAAQNTLRHQKPLFFPHFSSLQHHGGHAAGNPSRSLRHTKSIFSTRQSLHTLKKIKPATPEP